MMEMCFYLDCGDAYNHYTLVKTYRTVFNDVFLECQLFLKVGLKFLISILQLDNSFLGADV